MHDEIVRKRFRKLAKGLANLKITAKSDGVSADVDFKVVPPEWFKLPSKEYAIARGDEKMMECEFQGCKAHVFTASPYCGSITLSQLLDLSLNTISERSIFYSSLNAVMRYFGLVDRTLHCRGDEPIKCARKLAAEISDRFGDAPVLLVGYQPAMVRELTKEFTQVYLTDMSEKNVGRKVGSIQVLDHTKNLELIEVVEVVLATGSTIINSTLWPIYDKTKECNAELILYGVSGAGVAEIYNIERFCPCGL